MRKEGISAAMVHGYESKIKHPLFPNNAYLTVLPTFEVFSNSPLCELHALVEGFMEHIVKASVHKCISVLRRDDLVRDDGRHLIDDAKLGAFSHRLQDRWRFLTADERMVHISPSFIDVWRKVFVESDSGARIMEIGRAHV